MKKRSKDDLIPISEVPFKPKATKKSIKVGREYYQTHRIGSTTAKDFAAGNGKGVNVSQADAACHGDVMSPRFRDKENDWLVSRIWVRPKSLALCEYIGSDAFPFSRFILNRETLAEDKGIVVSTDAPVRFLHFLNLTSRMFTEHSYRAELFGDLLKIVENPSVAFILMACVGSGITKTFGSKVKDNLLDQKFYTSAGYHGSTFSQVDFDVIKNFLDHVYTDHQDKDEVPYRGNIGRYDGAYSLFRKPGSAYLAFETTLYADEEIVKALSEYRGDSEVKIKEVVKNPFIRKEPDYSPGANSKFSVREFIEVIVPILNKRYPKNYNA